MGDPPWGPGGKGGDRLGGDIDWDGNTPRYNIKTQKNIQSPNRLKKVHKTIQSPDRLYKAQTDYTQSRPPNIQSPKKTIQRPTHIGQKRIILNRNRNTYEEPINNM